MNDELLISIAFPGDTYHRVQEDIDHFLDEELDDEDKWERHIIEFFLYVIIQVIPSDEDFKKKQIESIFYPNINLISSQCFAEFFFNRVFIDAILAFLNKYDNEYFWDAFGISLDKGEDFYKKMSSLDENPNVFSEIHNEIINSRKLKKDILVNELSSYILSWNDNSEDKIEDMANFVLGIFKVTNKYPSLIEALQIVYENDNDNKMNDIFSSVQIIKELQDDSEVPLSPQSLFATIKRCFFIGCAITCLETIHRFLINENEIIKTLVLNSFRLHKYGYAVYLYYLVWCEKESFEPAFKIDIDTECNFFNSYKVPQFEPLYKRYFSELSDEEAKKKTKKCFEKIYDSLKEEGFLDKGCRKEEFLWAFGLTDEYPFAFKKIKFNTLNGRNKKDKGNGALLCLLTILGYTSEEIKAMLHRNPKKSNINKTFDLSLKDNTKMSKDYDALLDIVKSSELPIKK